MVIFVDTGALFAAANAKLKIGITKRQKIMKKIEANLVPPLDVWAGKAYLLDIWKKIRREFASIYRQKC